MVLWYNYFCNKESKLVGIIIDVSLFLAVLIFVMIGYFKGFLRTVVSLVGNLGAVVVAYFTKDLLAE